MSDGKKAFNRPRAIALVVLSAGLALLIVGLDHVTPIPFNLIPVALLPVLLVRTVQVDEHAVAAVTGLGHRRVWWSKVRKIVFEGTGSGDKPVGRIILRSDEARDLIIKTTLISPHETCRLVEALRQQAEARGLRCH